MEGEAALAAPDSRIRENPRHHRGFGIPVQVAVTAGCAAIAAAAFWVIRFRPYQAGAGFGYFLGIAGGLMLLSLLLYPFRKRQRWTQFAGPLRHWFRVHMVFGILAPLTILFHTGFRVGSLNAAVALSSMLLVGASGVVGRFVYRRIHHGLYGSRANFEELRKELDAKLANLAPRLARLPAVRDDVAHFLAIAGRQPLDRGARLQHFLTLGWQRHRAVRVARRAICTKANWRHEEDHERAAMIDLLRHVEATLLAVQRAAQFAAYERLFALWHVFHVPFVYMLAASAVIHVVAVHAY